MGRLPCCDKIGMKRGPWTPEEDIKLVSYVEQHGPGNWRAVPTCTGLHRCSKSCRLRWTNYLRPGIKRGNFTDHEEKMIIKLQALLGNKWAAIASYLPERTDNDIKNYWNTHLKKKLKKLQSGQEGPWLSSSSSISRGQWERRLQTDIKMAKQALHEALSLEKPSFVPQLKLSNEYDYDTYTSTTRPTQPCTYASSTDNIAKLLKGWMKNPIKCDQTDSSSTRNSFNKSMIDSSSSEDTKIAKKISGINGIDQSEFFELFGSSNSYGSDSMSPETGFFLVESKPDIGAQVQLSMLENWLLDDQSSVEGKEGFTKFLFDENADLF